MLKIVIMGKVNDLTGMRFGRLTIVKMNGRNPCRNVVWLCRCDCGDDKNVSSTHLLDGHTKSCGKCYWKREPYKQRSIPSFEDYVMPEPNTGCWIWTAGMSKSGYGMAYFNGKSQRANRVSYQIYKGEIPKGLYVLHTCDNPICVNPDHLFLGTPKDNSLDMMKKGRCGTAKITPTDVVRIRELLQERLTQKEIGSLMGVSQKLVSLISLRKTWAHVI